MVVEYRERVRRKYEELHAEKGTVEGEWRQYNDEFVWVAEELCGRTSGKGGTPRSRNQGWWTEEVSNAVGEKRETWRMIEGFRGRGEEPPTCSRHLSACAEEEGSQEGGGPSTDEFGGRTVPKA